jgi:hypothetical protein
MVAGRYHQNSVSAAGFQQSNTKFGTFSNRIELLTNSNVRQWRIFTNVRTRMNSLNSKNDLQTIIFAPTKHQKMLKTFFKKHFMLKQT